MVYANTFFEEISLQSCNYVTDEQTQLLLSLDPTNHLVSLSNFNSICTIHFFDLF